MPDGTHVLVAPVADAAFTLSKQEVDGVCGIQKARVELTGFRQLSAAVI